MIQAVNFMEREHFQVTYLTIGMVCGIALLFSLLLFGILKIATSRAENRRTTLHTEIAQLKQEREKLLHREELLQGSGPLLVIRNILEEEPPWTKLLKSIADNLPANAWLVSFKSSDKEAGGLKKALSLNGTTKSAKELATFLSHLEKTAYFDNVVLTSSTEEAGKFNFSIACEVRNIWKR